MNARTVNCPKCKATNHVIVAANLCEKRALQSLLSGEALAINCIKCDDRFTFKLVGSLVTSDRPLWFQPQAGRQETAKPEGEYCNGVDVDECREQFGAQLNKICATCPN